MSLVLLRGSLTEMSGYFSTIITFYQQMLEIQDVASSFFVGFPLDPQTGKGTKGPDYSAGNFFVNGPLTPIVPATVWTLNIYTDDSKMLQTIFSEFFSNVKPLDGRPVNVMPFISVDSFESETTQGNFSSHGTYGSR